MHAERRLAILELQADGVQAVLVALEHHQRGRLQLGDLPAQLRADRAAGAGHHHPPAVDQALERRRIEADRRAREQVFDRQAADLRRRSTVPSMMSRRLGSVLIGILNGSSARTIDADRRRVGARNRDQHFVGPVLLEDPRQILPRAEHRHAVDPPADLRRVVVDEADRLVAVLRGWSSCCGRSARRRRRRRRSARACRGWPVGQLARRRGAPAGRRRAARSAAARR